MGHLVSSLPSEYPALEVRRSTRRRYQRQRAQETWSTFDPDASDVGGAFSTFHNLVEGRWEPRASGYRRASRMPVQLITYVRAGRITISDATGATSSLRAGEFERTFAELGVRYVETNPSHTHVAHVFRISLRASESSLDHCPGRRCFAEAERKQRPVLVASRDGHAGSLSLGQDVSIYSALLYPGQPMEHELAPGRAVWLHVVRGSVSVGTLALDGGDGVRVDFPMVSVTSREHSELLVIEVQQPDSTGVHRRGNP
jgi:hypothetical protein